MRPQVQPSLGTAVNKYFRGVAIIGYGTAAVGLIGLVIFASLAVFGA